MNPFNSAGVELRVYVDEVPLLESSTARVRNITVESQFFLPSLCEIELVDNEVMELEQARLIPGALVQIRAMASEDPTGMVIFSGKIESVELRYENTSGVRSIVRAYDVAHKMMHGRKTRGFPMSIYSEVVSAVALEHGIEVVAEPTEVVFPSVVQANESDWDFLCRLAREVGMVLYVSVDPELGIQYLNFSLMAPAESAPPAVGGEGSPYSFEIGGESLITLRATATASGLTAIASSRGWDQTLATPGIGEGPTGGDAALNTLPPAALAAEFAGSQQIVSLEKFGINEAAVEAASVGLGQRMAGAYSNIEAIVRGNPFLHPNVAISIGKASNLTGDYTISAVTHTFEPAVFGYRTSFSCAGFEDRTLTGLQDAAELAGRLTGVYPAIVTDVEDPEQLSRVLLSFPWLDESYVSTYARVVQVGAGPGLGMQILPDPGDEVLVAFQNGQLDSPYVLGGLYSAERMGAVPPEILVEGTTMVRAFTSRDGHQILFNDNPEDTSVTLQTTFGASCIIRMSPEEGILITTIDGQPIILSSDAEVTVNAGGMVEVNATDVNITGEASILMAAPEVSITSEGDLNITSGGELALTGMSITISSGAEVNMAAEAINLEAGEIGLAGGIVSLGA
jgi:hypothetical protein